jgi:DNA polymerase-4
VSRLWGIGKKTEEHLKRLGIRTVGELASMPKKVMEENYGKMGTHLWNCAHGIDKRSVEPVREAKSVSNETTFFEDVADPRVHRETILYLAEKVGYRLRMHDLMGRTVTLKVRLADFTTTVRHSTLPQPVNLGEVIFQEAIRLYRSVDLKNQAVRLLGVGVAQLRRADAPRQGDLFDEEDVKRKRASEAVDGLKKRYGHDIIGKGGL